MVKPSIYKQPQWLVTIYVYVSEKPTRERQEHVNLPADKGNATVDLVLADYEAKMENLLQDTACIRESEEKPPSKVDHEVQVNAAALKECKCNGCITSTKHLSLSHQLSLPLQTYLIYINLRYN